MKFQVVLKSAYGSYINQQLYEGKSTLIFDYINYDTKENNVSPLNIIKYLQMLSMSIVFINSFSVSLSFEFPSPHIPGPLILFKHIN